VVTLNEVAKKAGVAPITVSRVVNGTGYVKLEVRRRVEAAVAELGYVPNSVARSLKSRRTNTLALVLSDLSNPFFTTVARGVEDAASDAGYMTIICNTDESESEERRYLRMLLQQRVDGILLVPASGTGETVRQLRKHGTEVVVLDRRVADAPADVARCDSEGGAYALGKLVAGLGHRRAAILAGPEGISVTQERVRGFRRAMDEAGAVPCSELHGEMTPESGRALATEALSLSPRPTALFAANNFIAIGALNALRDASLRVPEDIALVAFDDLPPALVTFPFLTVSAQPAYEMGRRGVELLFDRLEGRAPEHYREIVLPTELVVRRSSGDPV